MNQQQPFDSTHIKANGPVEVTWYQQVARNHAAHPGWSTAQHVAALNEMTGEGDMKTFAAAHGTTPEALVSEALEETQ
jgi:hypothetical protein